LRNRRSRIGAGHGQRLWPVLGILLLVVLVPTACMLWFLAAAMRNTSLAVRQRLTDAYRGQVLEAKQALAEHWRKQLAALDEAGPLPAPQRFRRLVAACAFDTVVLRAEGASPGYPAPPVPAPDGLAANAAWVEAQDIEFERTDPNAASAAYAAIAKAAADPSVRARALRAQARCLSRAGRTDRAIEVLTGPLAAAELARAVDPGGRLVAPAGDLHALQLLGDPNGARFRAVAERLRRRLDDYGEPVMPAGQRLFLMNELLRLGGADTFATRAAEQCAAEYLEAPQPPPGPQRFSRARGGALWHVASGDGRTVAVCREGRLIEASQQLCAARVAPKGITIRLAPPAEQASRSDAFLAAPAPGPLVGWQVEVHLVGESPFSAAAERQKATYQWTAILGIGVVLAAALIVAGSLGRQMRLARLKNDLIATVSHELKTPLSSMRVLIDTLVAGRCGSEQQADEYHRMIAKENERLSRVIENFLTFSRMERNRVAWEPVELDVAEVVSAAVESVRERFAGAGCELTVDVAPDLPSVRGDRDALVTVLLNLLDNAWKYTGAEKRVAVRAFADAGEVHLAVSDNGIGLSRREARRIFGRFYQVDQRLSRPAGGCGLGLSIVKFILDGHGGSIDVTSRPGEGTTFTVRLPAAGARENASSGA